MSTHRILYPLLLLLAFSLNAASMNGEIVENPFPIEENLLKFDFSNDEGDDVNIYLVTVEGGSEVYSYFGHSGLIIEQGGKSHFTDWGNFSFQDGFYRNFIMGLLYYSASDAPTEWRLSHFSSADRTIRILPLLLSEGKKEEMASFISYNLRPENRNYLYHYYKDNCATRIRDLYNAATEGKFETWARGISRGESYRISASRYLDQNFLMSLLLNFLEGPEIDKEIDYYDETFLPEVLEEAIAKYQNNESITYYESESRTHYNGPSLLFKSFICFSSYSLLISILYLSGKRAAMRIADLISSSIALILSIVSAVLLFMMCATNHDVTYFNANLILINPLYLIYTVEGLRGKSMKKRIRFSKLILILSFLTMAAKGIYIDLFIQDNIPYILLSALFALPYFLVSLKER